MTPSESGPARSVGLVLAGGHSRRMGRDKATLPAGACSALERVVVALRSAGLSTIILARPGQALPIDPGAGVEIWPDAPEASERGPLWALGHAFARLAGRGGDAFVTSCDAIALHPDDVAALLAQRRVADDEAVVVVDRRGRPQPLMGAYRLDAVARVTGALLAADERRVGKMLDGLRWGRARADDLRQPLAASPCNTPEQWRELCAQLWPS